MCACSNLRGDFLYLITCCWKAKFDISRAAENLNLFIQPVNICFVFVSWSPCLSNSQGQPMRKPVNRSFLQFFYWRKITFKILLNRANGLLKVILILSLKSHFQIEKQICPPSLTPMASTSSCVIHLKTKTGFHTSLSLPRSTSNLLEQPLCVAQQATVSVDNSVVCIWRLSPYWLDYDNISLSKRGHILVAVLKGAPIHFHLPWFSKKIYKEIH